MKKLMGLGMAVLVAGALTAGCSSSSTPNDQAKAADAKLGGGNCVQLATTWAQLFTPLQAGGVSDSDKANIKKQISDMKSQVPANIGTDLDKISTGIDGAKSTTDVATFVSSKDFTTANQDVSTYLTTQCATLGK
jgi:ABC-type glycerol-3-phosphate transport system substrate-binding protein